MFQKQGGEQGVSDIDTAFSYHPLLFSKTGGEFDAVNATASSAAPATAAGLVMTSGSGEHAHRPVTGVNVETQIYEGEFHAAALAPAPAAANPSREERMQAILEASFRRFDKDDSGFISADEMLAILTHKGGGKALSIEDAKRVVADFDTDGDGHLDVTEFSAFLGAERKKNRAAAAARGAARARAKKKHRAVSKAEVAAVNTRIKRVQETQKEKEEIERLRASGVVLPPSTSRVFQKMTPINQLQIEKVFRQFDADADGAISLGELDRMISSLGGLFGFGKDADASILLSLLDADGDQLISWQEWSHACAIWLEDMSTD